MAHVLIYRKTGESQFKLYHPTCVTTGTGGPLPIPRILTNSAESQGREFKWFEVSDDEAVDVVKREGVAQVFALVHDPETNQPVGLYRFWKTAPRPQRIADA